MTSAHLEPSSFVFTVCQQGSERALKHELGALHPTLRFAFSRPGFVTFKAPEPIALDVDLRTTFARAFGVSLGELRAEANSIATEVLEHAASLRGSTAVEKVRLHVFERDLHAAGEEPLGFERGALAREVDAAIREGAAKSGAAAILHDEGKAQLGDTVLDVIVLDPNVYYAGAHLHHDGHSQYPGGAPALTMPIDAPSRAYLKLEEALRWSKLPLRSGDTAVELGSAPGGAAFALLARGLKVVGIDPAVMDPRVMADRSFTHLQRPIGLVRREDLPRRIEWLLADLNLEPQVTLAQVARLAQRIPSLHGVLLTLKLGSASAAMKVPVYLEQLRKLGFADARAAQLSTHRKELVVAGLSERGRARSANKPRSSLAPDVP